VQLSTRIRSVAIATGVGLACARVCSAQETPDDQTLATLLRWFGDSNHVSVRSAVGDYSVPLANGTGLMLHWNNEKVTVPGITGAPGSQEAIDAITTASHPISGNPYADFVKVRNELQAEMSKGGAAVSYYHSSEVDYLAQQVAARYARDLRGQQLNLSVGTSYGWDQIDPVENVNNPVAPATKNTLHANAVATEVLSPASVLRVGVEVDHVEGLQHNPYRRVYAGGTSVPENQPTNRLRRDAFVKFNQYLANRSSLKFSYRFYNDDWGVMSHETGAQLSQYLTSGLNVQYRYRWYTQTAADFYRAEYLTTNGVDGYLTGDYRLGPLSSHLFDVTLQMDLGVLAASSRAFRHLGVTLDYGRYFNSNNYSADILETGVDFRF
jgi:hypothetical protein